MTVISSFEYSHHSKRPTPQPSPSDFLLHQRLFRIHILCSKKSGEGEQMQSKNAKQAIRPVIEQLTTHPLRGRGTKGVGLFVSNGLFFLC